MNAKELRNELINIFGNNIVFNKEFDYYAEQLKEEMQIKLLEWCKKCKQDLFRGHTPLKPHLKDLYVFFKKIGNKIRTILIKIKNADFIEIHLSDHKYYDEKRKEFGFKKSSYYRS